MTQRRICGGGISNGDWTREIEHRIDELIGEEDKDIEDILGNHQRRPKRRRECEFPTRGDLRASPLTKNVIPSDVSSPCARSLEVWIMNPRDADRRLTDAYEHVVNTCRGVTDLVVFRGTCWDERLWKPSWEARFMDLRNIARSKVSIGQDSGDNQTLANLHVALKLYGRRHPVVRLVP